uniref:Glucose-methanol-choline oxidoreductase N-terminal domain-containing protein n=1 Tax=Bracon brevicornis TaxID=1563983 RepID=A0A6V7K9M6_9HYME
MDSCPTQSCAAAIQGNSPLIFHQLLQTLLLSQCTLGNPDHYPPNKMLEIESMLNEPFDFIVVGGGTAGSVLASRLSEREDWRILLIEAGTYPSAISDVPALLLLLEHTPEDYDYIVEYQDDFCKGTARKHCTWSKGKALGGSSVINAMLHVHGNPRDFDSWEEAGNEGWSFEKILPYIKKSENYPPEFIAKFGDANVGKNGQINIRSFNYSDSDFPKIISEAVNEKGIPSLDYVNGEKYIGFGQAYGTVDNGRRVNAAKAYLSPAKNRKNLFVMTSTRADRIVMEGSRAVGVEVTLPDNKLLELRASKEVIISAGSIATPQLLMLSGIGPREHLNEFNIACIADLPVGKNLQDHLIWMGIQLSFYNESTVVKTPKDLLDDAYLYLMHNKGEFTNSGGIDFMGFINIDDTESKFPNMQFHHIYISRGSTYKVLTMNEALGFSEELTAAFVESNMKNDIIHMAPTLIHPKSHGEIKLRSASPTDPVKIFANYLKEDEDKVAMLKAYEFIKSLEETKSFKKYGIKVKPLSIPGCKQFQPDSMDYWECNLRHTTGTIYHPVGTAKMGPAGDSTAVVNHELKVHNIDNLRVIDASIMPTITSGNTNSPVLTIAEKGADLIKKAWSNRDEL